MHSLGLPREHQRPEAFVPFWGCRRLGPDWEEPGERMQLTLVRLQGSAERKRTTGSGLAAPLALWKGHGEIPFWERLSCLVGKIFDPQGQDGLRKGAGKAWCRLTPVG